MNRNTSKGVFCDPSPQESPQIVPIFTESRALLIRSLSGLGYTLCTFSRTHILLKMIGRATGSVGVELDIGAIT